jgi:hypothetical protein
MAFDDLLDLLDLLADELLGVSRKTILDDGACNAAASKLTNLAACNCTPFVFSGSICCILRIQSTA